MNIYEILKRYQEKRAKENTIDKDKKTESYNTFREPKIKTEVVASYGDYEVESSWLLEYSTSDNFGGYTIKNKNTGEVVQSFFDDYSTDGFNVFHLDRTSLSQKSDNGRFVLLSQGETLSGYWKPESKFHLFDLENGKEIKEFDVNGLQFSIDDSALSGTIYDRDMYSRDGKRTPNEYYLTKKLLDQGYIMLTNNRNHKLFDMNKNETIDAEIAFRDWTQSQFYEVEYGIVPIKLGVNTYSFMNLKTKEVFDYKTNNLNRRSFYDAIISNPNNLKYCPDEFIMDNKQELSSIYEEEMINSIPDEIKVEKPKAPKKPLIMLTEEAKDNYHSALARYNAEKEIYQEEVDRYEKESQKHDDYITSVENNFLNRVSSITNEKENKDNSFDDENELD